MEELHPVAQVAGIIIIGFVLSVLILATITDFFDELGKRKK